MFHDITVKLLTTSQVDNLSFSSLKNVHYIVDLGKLSQTDFDQDPRNWLHHVAHYEIH